jgi:hypothetical protein
MDDIKNTLKTLINENCEWIKYLTLYPNSCNNLSCDELFFYKELKSYKDCKSSKSYNIFKKLLQSQGIRSVHPAWFFILKEHFEKDNFIFEEETIDSIDVLNFSVPDNFKMPHRIQIIGTLKIYYSLLTHSKIYESFIDERSKFVNKYIEFKDIYKYLFFPKIEEKIDTKFIDLSYNFNEIMNNIQVEINEPHHIETTDIKREQLIYFKTNNRIIQCYLSKDIKKKKKNIQTEVVQINKCINEVIPKVIDDILFRMTMSIYNKNKFAGLTFNAFIKDIINNLFLAVFFSELKKESTSKILTWKKFREYCKAVEIYIERNYIEIINNELSDDETERGKDLKELFYNYTELNDKTLLTETGYDYYLMQLSKKQSCNSLSIKRMYSKYKQEYDKLMDDILTEKNEELEYTRKHAETKEHFLMMVNKYYRCEN